MIGEDEELREEVGEEGEGQEKEDQENVEGEEKIRGEGKKEGGGKAEELAEEENNGLGRKGERQDFLPAEA